MTDSDWRIGVLFSRTGVTAAAETSEANAALLAAEEINKAGGVLGRDIRPIIYDPSCSIKEYRECAVRLLAEDNVRIVFGCYMSSERKVVLPEIESYRGLLFYPTFYEGFEYSPRCFYGGASANQNAVALARYLIDNFGTRFLLVGSNYVFPYEYNRVVTDLVNGAGGSILDEIYVPVEARQQDFDKLLKKIDKLRPDVIVSTVVGTGTKLLYETYKAAGFDAKDMPIASLTMTEAEVAQVRPEVVADHLTSASFFETVDTPEAHRFVSAFKKSASATMRRSPQVRKLPIVRFTSMRKRSPLPAATIRTRFPEIWQEWNSTHRRAGSASIQTTTTRSFGHASPASMRQESSTSSGNRRHASAPIHIS